MQNYLLFNFKFLAVNFTPRVVTIARKNDRLSLQGSPSVIATQCLFALLFG